MKFETFTFTDAGGRSPNEDCAGDFANDGRFAWIVADGLGGHVHGETASAEAVKDLGEAFAECKVIDQKFIQATFENINLHIADLKGPMTTAVCAFSDGEKLFYSNCGDSRFYFFRDCAKEAQTHDHSIAYICYLQGDITYDEIRSHPGQSRLLRALGSEETVRVEQYDPITLQPGDAFLLCTDGFWELVFDEEMEVCLQESQSAEDWFKRMKEYLKTRFKENSDNYTVVLVKVTE